MLWREKGVQPGSYMCFFDPPDAFREHFYYMVSCGFFHCVEGYRISNEGSRPPLFFYVTGGSLHLEYGNESYTAQKGDIILINCYHKHCYYCSDDCEFLFFHFNGKDAPTISDHLIAQNHGPIFDLKNKNHIYNNINEPIMRLCYQEFVTDDALSSLVYSTLCMIQAGSMYQPESLAAGGSASIAEKSIEYIKAHIHHNITLKDLSDYTGLSPYYFSRLFKKETGYSPIDYVSMMKINYAKLMLRTTSVSVAEIADSLGYSSESSFINAFKLRRGISPFKYRKLDETRQNKLYHITENI